MQLVEEAEFDPVNLGAPVLYRKEGEPGEGAGQALSASEQFASSQTLDWKLPGVGAGTSSS